MGDIKLQARSASKIHLHLALCITIFFHSILTTHGGSFYAMGDGPYFDEEYDIIGYELQNLDEEYDNADFIIHVGDIMKIDAQCGEDYYRNADNMFFDNSRLPVFIIPGDNDWNDCVDMTQAWEHWRFYFDNYEDWWDHYKLPVTRQTSRYENFAFLRDRVLFLGLNLVGAPVRNPNEWNTRLQQNFEWTKSNLEAYIDDNVMDAVVIFGHTIRRSNVNGYFDELFKLIDKEYRDIHFMYLHGDGHEFIRQRVSDNFIDVMVDRAGKDPMLKITVKKRWDIDSTFTIDRRAGSLVGAPRS